MFDVFQAIHSVYSNKKQLLSGICISGRNYKV